MLKYFVSTVLFAMACATVAAQDVPPLIQTRWGQRDPFNRLCPMADSVSGEKALAGCGPIAMAQIIRYVEEPSASPSGGDYQWEAMTAFPSTRQEGLAIAKLVADCGLNAFTSYGKESSSTKTHNAVNALKKHFGYNPYIAIVNRKLYPGEEGRRLWQKMIFEELRAGRPVLACGYNENIRGHLFVIDGLKDTLVHVNFGWSGDKNGYYTLDDLGGFARKQSVAIGLGKADYTPPVREVTTSRAGQLAELLPQEEWPELHHLKISGPLDASDFKLLRLMATEDTIGGRHGFLHSLDLRDARLAYLPDAAFEKAQSLVYIRLPKGLRQIGRDAFRDCKGLNEIEIPVSVWRIRGWAFINCKNLLDIHIPRGVHNILTSTFLGCENLTEVTLPASIDTLGAWVFSGCQRLERLYIPAATTHIGAGLLKNCPNIREVIINPANTNYAYRDGQIVGLTERARLQLGQAGRGKPASLKSPASRSGKRKR